jgi:predicted N-acetyltransferase YhbS
MTAQPSAPVRALSLQLERPQDGALVDGLLDRAFGPGRFTKVSERVREFAEFAADLSFCAWEDERLVGVVRQWRVRVGERPVVFLGPLAVEQVHRSAGLGGLLVARACKAAKAAGETAILLVGDEPYFGRLGFSAAKASQVRLPGPVDQARVLVRELTDGEPLAGLVQP